MARHGRHAASRHRGRIAGGASRHLDHDDMLPVVLTALGVLVLIILIADAIQTMTT